MSTASCAACRPASASTQDARRRPPAAGAAPSSIAALMSVESATDSTYSMTRKSSPSASTTSMTGTTFGWWMHRRDARLVAEHVVELAIREQVRVHALDDDEALEPRGADLPRHVDRRHAAGGELQQRLVVAELQAGTARACVRTLLAGAGEPTPAPSARAARRPSRASPRASRPGRSRRRRERRDADRGAEEDVGARLRLPADVEVVLGGGADRRRPSAGACRCPTRR